MENRFLQMVREKFVMVSFFQIAIYHLIKIPNSPKDDAGKELQIVNTLSTWTGIFWLEMLDDLSRRLVYLENVLVGKAKNCRNSPSQ